jgi:hypothetical protein
VHSGAEEGAQLFFCGLFSFSSLRERARYTHSSTSKNNNYRRTIIQHLGPLAFAQSSIATDITTTAHCQY